MRSRILTIVMFALILLAIILFIQMRKQRDAADDGLQIGMERITRITS